MTLRTIAKTEKSRDLTLFLDDRCVGTLPVKVLPLFVRPFQVQEIDREEAAELWALLKSHARSLLLDYLAKAEHSEHQSRELLKKRGFDKAIIDELIDYCKEKKFIDDARYSEIYIRSWLKRGIGLKLLRSKLREQRIAQSIWEPLLEEMYEPEAGFDTLKTQMQKYISRQKEMPYNKLKDKTFGYFVNKGFDLDLIAGAWRALQ
ncbi:MAG TPA: RecX family transcriptional regulator [Candidatus Cloacimonadota bacterium]|nr:RecX family transcriptional regulator [Candidatus Cloacimonadota bacterium]